MKISIKDFDKIPKEQRNEIYEIENKITIYYVNGKLHRDDGPAIDRINGDKYWFINGKLHRLDGPAIEFEEKKEYWIEDVEYYTKEWFEKSACSYYMYKNGLQDYL